MSANQNISLQNQNVTAPFQHKQTHKQTCFIKVIIFILLKLRDIIWEVSVDDSAPPLFFNL
jgi:hypothetical protein